MRMNPRERDLGGKKEEEGEDMSSNKFPSLTPSSSSSRQWSSCFKNPRIVRVSRAFGGKDRHSKVCTIRGLRDRRIRLSVPTAIQLYYLQERLGLSQPSKVIDWLLDATKQEIDKLPPLPIIPTNFLQFHHQLPALPSLAAAKANPNPNPNTHPSSPPYHVSYQFPSPNLFKEREINGDEGGFGGFVAQNFFPTNSHHQFSVANLPYNNNPNYFQLEQQPPNLSLSQFGAGFSFSNRADDDHDQEQHPNCRLSSSSHASTSQIYSCPSAATLLHFPPPYNNNFIAPSSLENDNFRQINHLQNPTVHFINSPMKSFSFNEEKQDKDSRSS